MKAVQLLVAYGVSLCFPCDLFSCSNVAPTDFVSWSADSNIDGRVRLFFLVVYCKDQRIKFYSQNTNLLPPKPKSTFRHLKQGIQDFHRKYVLVPADKAANNVVVV